MKSHDKINIYLQYPWKFPDSPYYKYLVDSPPKNIKYLNDKGRKGASSNAKKFKITQKLKNFIKDTPQKFGITIVNAHKTKSKQKYDLIHCAHCLSKERKPWVADLEMGGSLLISGFKNKNWQRKVGKYLRSPYCKKRIPWTNFVKKRILQDFPDIEKKLEVVYPAVPQKRIKKRKNKVPTFIFVSRSYSMKGGYFALEVMKKIKERYNSRCIFISDFPKGLQFKYPGIEMYPLIPHEKVQKLMSESDVFLYPSFIDTFGFAILEAMSWGLPVIALKTPGTNSIEEMIDDRKTGFFIRYDGKKSLITEISEKEKKVIEELYSKCNKLVDNPNLRNKMSRNCIKIIKSGKFSIKERNKKLKKIYEEALK